DRVVLLTGRQDVRIAVAVHVQNRDVIGADGKGRGGALRERRRRSAVVFEEDEAGRDVDVAILVEIGGFNGLAREADGAGRPAGQRAGVFIPDELAVETRDG